ncbi:MAG: hypothetical protein FJ125_16630, partial [Deltaproteobacteria bacterium]|nr:hypothetical protein [Deltaproteobacteria bacterium]
LLGAPRLVRARLETDVQQLTEHFRRLGYKDASITVREQRVAPDAVDVEITVREGIPYRVSRVEVKGQALPADLEGKLRTRVDQPWTQEALHADALTIATWFKDRGYPDAEAIPASTFQPPVAGAAGGEPRWGRAAVVLAIDRHAQVHVEKIWFSGNTITSRETLLKMVTVRPGELFRQSALEDSKQNMLRSGLFRDVAVEVLPGSDSGRRFVIFRVVEAFRLRLDAAGPTVTLSNLNVLSFPSSMAELEHGTLFAGGGQELQLGFAPDDLRLAFRDPYIFGFLTGSTKVSRTVSRPGGKELVVWGITPAFGLSFAQGKLVGQLFWRGEWAGLEGGGGSKASPVLSAGQDDLLLSSGGVIGRLDLTQRDDADRFPFLGLALELRYEQASSALGSELDFLGGGTGLKTYLPLGTNAKGQHAAFTFSGQLDWLHPQRDTLPYHRRFWPTLRGYTGSSLGRKEQLASPAGAAFAVGGEGAFSLELGLRLPIPLGRRNALMPFAAAGGLWEGDPPDDLSQVFTSGGLELTFSALEERLEGSLWLAYPFGGPPSGWEASYVGGSLGGSL